MKKGFTILELLVASLLLGMLVTILTMIFNQSSIAWRTGTAVIKDLGVVRENIAAVRDEADNVYVWNQDTLLLLSPWNEAGELRSRAISADTETSAKPGIVTGLNDTSEPKDLDPSRLKYQNAVGSRSGPSYSYIVNVKSAGPNRKFGGSDGYDDIWSYPDDFEDE
jgi:prepilin-type N-terminal cleavage/methylation domain-containing protein